jgi:hypothetical protein
MMSYQNIVSIQFERRDMGRIKFVTKSFIILVVVAIFNSLPLSGHADVVFDQGDPTGGMIHTSSTLRWVGDAGDYRYRTADDFQLTTSSIVTGAEWWGNSTGGLNYNFTFTFYLDDNGKPGTIVQTSTVSAGSLSVSGNDYTATLDSAFHAMANTLYWLSIYDAASDAVFKWVTTHSLTFGGYGEQTPGIDGFGWGPLVPWMFDDFVNPDSGNLSFRLISNADPVPEPATMLLFGTGIAGLIGSRIRRKK